MFAAASAPPLLAAGCSLLAARRPPPPPAAPLQWSGQGVYYALRFTAYFPCVAHGEGRYVVIEAIVYQPEPRFQPAYSVVQVVGTSTLATDGIGWGADVGESWRDHLQGEHARHAWSRGGGAAGTHDCTALLKSHRRPHRPGPLLCSAAAASFTRQSTVNALDIAVDSSDPSNIWCGVQQVLLRGQQPHVSQTCD